MKECRRRRFSAFTLVELMVVIAIIAMLAALLFPALAAARYRARILRCVNQMHQMGIGIASYTSDNNGYYPDGGEGRAHPSEITKTLGSNGITVPFDFRPAFRQYFDTKRLNTILKCPATWDWWWTKDAFGRDDIDKYTGSVKTPYAFYFGLNLPYANSSGQSWNYWPREEPPMRKSGDTFRPKGSSKRFNVLMSDATYGNFGALVVNTAHQNLRRTGYLDGGGSSSYFNWNACLQYFPGTEVTANYGLDDLSVKTYSFNPGNMVSYFTRFNNSGGYKYLVPTELGH